MNKEAYEKELKIKIADQDDMEKQRHDISFCYCRLQTHIISLSVRWDGYLKL